VAGSDHESDLQPTPCREEANLLPGEGRGVRVRDGTLRCLPDGVHGLCDLAMLSGLVAAAHDRDDR